MQPHFLKSLICLICFLAFSFETARPQTAVPEPEPAKAPTPTPTPDPEWYGKLEALTYDKNGLNLPYRVFKPEKIEEGKVYPLILFLHGVGECGTDNKKQLQNSVEDIIKGASKKEPFFLIAPQSKGWWVGVPWNLDSHVMPEKTTPSMSALIELLDEVQKTYPLDPKRLYVTGLSMGGLGTWDIISRYPEKFAAALPVCGAADTAQGVKLKDLPVWTFHGDNDTTIKVQRSRDMVEAIRKAGGHPVYSELPGVGHAAWVQAYRNIYVYDWLFAQSKN